GVILRDPISLKSKFRGLCRTEVEMATMSSLIPRLTLYFLVMAAFAPAAVFGQSTAEVRGVVQDESGGVIPGVNVTTVNELTGLARTMVSDAGGRFNFPRLPVGTYRVEAELQGFRKFATPPFRLDVEDIKQVNVSMAVGAVSEGVTVAGTAA